MNLITSAQNLVPLDLNNLSVQQLRAELAQSLTMSAQHLAYLAGIWAELERRGEDLSDLKTGLATYLPQIAAGRLSAAAVIRFAGQPTVLRSISTLSLTEQEALANGKSLNVLTIGSNGEYGNRNIPAYALTASQARIVFGDDKIRTLTEQQAIFDTARLSVARRVPPGQDGRVRYDPKTDMVRIGRSSATVGEVLAALASAVPPSSVLSSDDDVFQQTAIKLPDATFRKLKIRIAESGMTQQEFIEKLLIRSALL